MRMLKIAGKWLQTRAAALLGHRAIYTGLAACHASGCVITDKPELYAPMAILYALLALRAGKQTAPNNSLFPAS